MFETLPGLCTLERSIIDPPCTLNNNLCPVGWDRSF